MEFIGISYAGRGIYIKKPATWDELLQTVSQRLELWDDVTSLRVLYSTDMSGTSPRWELDASAWPGVKSDSSIYFEDFEDNENPQDRSLEEAVSGESETTIAARDNDQKRINISVLDQASNEAFYTMKRSTKFKKVHSCLATQCGRALSSFYLLYNGGRVFSSDTPASLNVQDGDSLEVRSEQRGGKPAIYLLTPTPLETVTVSVSLQPEWDFTVIYPITKTKNPQKSTSEVTWVVSVQADGILVNKYTGRQSSYLFWEASTAPNGMLQLFPPKEDDATFNPANPLAFFTSSHMTITLPFEEFEPYLDSVLESLTLTPAMRTEFIVYWLPSFQHIRDRGQNIQFTFVPQDIFNKAATLTVSGAIPKAVARIFMLFRGVCHRDRNAADTDTQQNYATELPNEVDWPNIVGLDVDVMKDESAFRVLEWGGMEVTIPTPN